MTRDGAVAWETPEAERACFAEKRRTGRMQAAVLTGDRQVRLEEVALPEPGEGQVRVRLEGCGVCASNIPVWEGRPWFSYPLEPGSPGHEGWGVVDQVGAGVTRVRPGDRVAALSYHAYAEYDVADETAMVKLPAELASTPVPGEPLGCAVNVLRRSDIRSGDTVAVVGVGFLGAILVQLAAHAGARVVAVSRRPFALRLAGRFGASETILYDDRQHVLELVNKLTGGEGCQRVIEVTGKQEPLDLAGDLTAVRGRLIIAGYHQDGIRQVNMQQWNWRGIDVINAHERQQQVYIEGIDAAVRELVAGRLDPSPMYTHTFRLDQLADALAAAAQRAEGFLKALVLVDRSAA